ncbi:MAG: MBL fold metallo-hydrolase [Kiritimatiellia bacterium]
MMMTLRFLGTGWSHGVPSLGCTCEVCTGGHPKNQRLRSSVLLEQDGFNVVVDVGPDFREQALRNKIRSLDAVLITHQHADHVMGLDDVRRFSWMQGAALPVWAEASVLERLRELYPYASDQTEPRKAVPLLKFSEWTSPVEVGRMKFRAFRVPHGSLPCVGIRIDAPGGSIGYVPDCSALPDPALNILAGVDVMILNALRLTPHPSHLTLDQSVAWLQKINAPRSFLTHMGCPIDYETRNPGLPGGVEMAWDGLEIRV